MTITTTEKKMKRNTKEKKMSKLVISEKSSVAQSIAKVLGATSRKEGYIEGGNYIVTWCVGHLAAMANAEVYDEKYAKWRYDDLPIVPQKWEYVPEKDKAKQFEVIRELMNRDDVDEIINACDAGREGELIFRTVYYLAGCTKTMKRLWISSMEDEAVREGMKNLRPGSEYDGLYRSALCRSRADWLVGINATRLFSILYHRKLNVGRVVSPTLSLIVQRECDIDAFKPEPFYTVQLDCDSFTASSERMKDKSQAEKIKQECCGNSVTVKSIERKEKSERPPLLFDLTTLQRTANRELGYTSQQTLDYLQSLYEKKLCTYPRTDSRYLTDDMVSLIPELVRISADICKAEQPVTMNTTICNSQKVTDHHAIVPTVSAMSADIPVLPTGEREILRLVSRQLLCAVSEPFRYAETVAVLDCAGHIFTVKGRETLADGWKAYTENEQNDKVLPELKENGEYPVKSVSLKEGTTTPPAHFTEDSLLYAMETAGKEDMPEEAERKGLGTPATRAAILEKLIRSGFVERKKSKKSVNLIPTHAAFSLITVLPEQLKSPLLTAEWEYRLKQVEHGELNADEFLSDIAYMLSDLTKNYHAVQGAEVLFPSGRDVIGRCPRCRSEVTESKKGFFCENTQCRFGMWRDNKFWKSKHVTLTKAQASEMLQGKHVHMKKLYSEKTGRTYDAYVKLDDNGEFVRYRMEFDRGSDK